jgi:hypothetical protein
VGAIIVWEVEEVIGDMLKSIERFVDRIIVIDGTYKPFATHFRSADETMTKVGGFTKPKIIIGNHMSKPYSGEVFTRNLYMLPQYYMSLKDDKPKTPHWIFVIDADEYIMSGVEETIKFLENSNEPYHHVRRWTMAPWGKIGGGQRIQLYRYIKGMKYVDNHFTIEYPDGTRVRTDTPASLAPLHIMHQRERKSMEYLKDMDLYNREFREKVEYCKDMDKYNKKLDEDKA